jgi:photosystem II stability/assembly factor-like uncharacterized protein
MTGCSPLIIILMLPAAAGAAWQCMGPEGGTVSGLAQSWTDPDDLYCICGSNPAQVFSTTDAGQTWTIAGSLNTYPYAFACGPTGTLFCGASSYFHRSTNGGATWISSYQSNTIFYGVAPHPTIASTVYATGYRYNGSTWLMFFARSTDSGATWTYTYLDTVQSYGYGIAVSKSDPSVILVSGYTYTGSSYLVRLFRSTDGGTNFTNITPAGASGEYYSYSVAIHPTDPGMMLLGTLYSIWRSTDGGASWTDCSNTTYNYSLEFSAANPSVALAGGSSGIYRSTNGGQSWTSVTTGLTGTGFESVIPSHGNQNQAFSGSTAGFFTSSNGGTSWTASNDGIYAGQAVALASAPSQPSTVFAQLTDMGIWKSTDSGTNWTHLTTPLTCGNFCGIAVNPTNPAQVLALEGGG